MAMQLELFNSPYMVRGRASAQAIWKNRWFGWLMIGAFSLWYFWWCVSIPSPAKAATVLAVIAAIMAYRGEPEGFEKLFWTLVLFAFLFLELNAIDHKEFKDRLERSAENTKQDTQFTGIGTSLQANVKKLLDDSDSKFKQTLDRQSQDFSKTMDQVTGGNGYAVVLPTTSDSTASSLPIGVTMCGTCDTSINASIYVQSNPFPGSDLGKLIFQGQVNPHSMLQIGSLDAVRGRGNMYRIAVAARNKPTVEALTIRFNEDKQHWEFSYSIAREVKQAHFNPKTRMAEGETFKILQKETGWMQHDITPSNPATIQVIH